MQDGEEVSVDFFDMDYAHNAQRNQEMFNAAHRKSILTDSNHPATVHETDAWYVENFDIKEISFSIKSFIVAVDTDYYASLNEDDLTAFASELLIWEQ